MYNETQALVSDLFPKRVKLFDAFVYQNFEYINYCREHPKAKSKLDLEGRELNWNKVSSKCTYL